MTPCDYRAWARTARFQGRPSPGLSARPPPEEPGPRSGERHRALVGAVYETSADLGGVPGSCGSISRRTRDGCRWRRRRGRSAQWFAAHRLVVGLLGLDQDAAGFVRLARRLGLARLVAGRPGLRLIRTPSVLDGLLWSIIGQQINLPFACVLKRRLIEHTGTALPGGLFSLPSAAAIARLSPPTCARGSIPGRRPSTSSARPG
jgi:hypothetical protein